VVMALLLAVGGGCDKPGLPGAGGDKPAETKAPSPDGLETSWAGHVSKSYEGGLSACTEIVKAALKKLAIEVTEEKTGIFETTLEAESRDGTSLIVILKEVSRTETRVSIKVGYLLGDRDAARRIHSEVQSEVAAKKSARPWSGATRPAMPGTP